MAFGSFGLYQSGGIPGVQIPSVNDGGSLFQDAFNSFAEIKKGENQTKVDGAKTDIERILEAREKDRLREEGLISRMLSPEFQRQQLENKLAFDRQQMAQAAPYKLAFALPGQIMTAFTKPAEIALAGQLASSQALLSGASGAANIIANENISA